MPSAKKQPKKNGRPTKRTGAIVDGILAALRLGTPLTIACRDASIGVQTFYDWMDADKSLSVEVGRARDVGWDAIALEAVEIADDPTRDTIRTKKGAYPDKEWIERSKLRVHTRLQLLRCWDPKRYGDKMQHTGDGGGAIKLSVSSEDASL